MRQKTGWNKDQLSLPQPVFIYCPLEHLAFGLFFFRNADIASEPIKLFYLKVYDIREDLFMEAV